MNIVSELVHEPDLFQSSISDITVDDMVDKYGQLNQYNQQPSCSNQSPYNNQPLYSQQDTINVSTTDVSSINKTITLSEVQKHIFNVLSSIEKVLTDYNDKGYIPIYPKEYNSIAIVLNKYVHRDDAKIVITDDIDFDGVSSCYIIYKYLKKINPMLNITIVCPKQHGVDEEVLSRVDNERCDLLIIADSSTNLVSLYANKPYDVIVLDHHIIDEDTLDITSYSGCSNLVINCNSKNTKGLENISAGMLCYLVFSKYYQSNLPQQPSQQNNLPSKHNQNDLDLFEIGAVSLIADIVPVDDFVMSTLVHYYKNFRGSTKLIKVLSTPNVSIDKHVLQFTVIPMINYSKRLRDDSLIKLLIKTDLPELVFDKLSSNRAKGKNIVNLIETYSSVKESEHHVYADITNINQYLLDDIAAFKGLYCNKLMSSFNKSAIVRMNEGISVRSKHNQNGLVYFQKHCISGGGHNNACGFSVNPDELPNMLVEYDKYLDNISDNYMGIDMLEYDRIPDKEQKENVIVSSAYCNLIGYDGFQSVGLYSFGEYQTIIDELSKLNLKGYCSKVTPVNKIDGLIIDKSHIDNMVLIYPVISSDLQEIEIKVIEIE